MATTWTKNHSEVCAFIESADFVSGDTIMLPPGGGVITLPRKKWDAGGKDFTIINPDPTTVNPNGLGAGIPFRALGTNTTVIRGTYFNGAAPAKIALRRCDWTIVSDIPDWVGSGKTWTHDDYNWGQALIHLGMGGELDLEDCHFYGPQAMTTVNTGYGDSPAADNYRICTDASSLPAGDRHLTGTCHEGATPYSVWTGAPAVASGRGLPTGQADYRNLYVHPTYGRLLYNEMAGRPAGINGVRLTRFDARHCSFNDLYTCASIVTKKDTPCNFRAYKCWIGSTYDDQWRYSGDYLGSTDVSQQFVKLVGCIWGGVTAGSSLDLVNPHNDMLQMFSVTAPALEPNLLIKNCLFFTGSVDGARGQMQGQFTQSRFKGPKLINSYVLGANKGTNSDGWESPYVVNVTGLVPGWFTLSDRKANGSSADLFGAGITVKQDTLNDPSTAGANGYIAKCVGQLSILGGVKQVKNVNVPANQDDAYMAVALSSRPASMAEAFNAVNNKARSGYNDIAEYLNDADNWDNVVARAVPQDVIGIALTGDPVLSYKELIHVGDFGSTATIEMVTPGLQWREWGFDGSTPTADATSAPGTITDHKRLQLIATNPPTTSATAKTYLYKVNGQYQTWTVVTKSFTQYPAVSKPASGQYQKTGAGALIASPTSNQYRRGMIWLRASFASQTVSNLNWLVGTATRTLRCSISTDPSKGVAINFAFGNSSGGLVAALGTPGLTQAGHLVFNTLYDFFFNVDMTLATGNVGLQVYDVATGNVALQFVPATATPTDIAWDYSHAANGLNFANNLQFAEFHGLAVWAGSSLTGLDDDGNTILVPPPLVVPEVLGYRGAGINGVQPDILILGETAVSNRGKATGGTWSTTSALTDVGGRSWSNGTGLGPTMALGADMPLGELNANDVIDIPVRCFGSNEPLNLTPVLSAGLELVGGPTIAMGENARSATVTVKVKAHGNQTIGFTNNVGYINPPALALPIGRRLPFTVLPGDGYGGQPYATSVRFAPA